MKIAIYIDKGVYGGGQRVLITLAREFYNRGLNPVVYTRQKEFDTSVVPCKVVTIDTAKGKFFQIIQFRNSFIKEQIDRIIVFGCDTICYIATLLTRVKYIYSLRVDPLQVNFNKFSYKHIINHCYKIVFQTNKVQKHFTDNVKKRSMVIPNPILDDNLPEIQKEREKHVVLVARLSEEKNIPMAIHAFSKVNRKGYTLHLYGIGNQMDELKKLVSELKLEKEVIFEGHVTRVIEKIKNAEILLLTSNFEGMPNALIEGLAMGLACITTDFPSGAASDLIEDEKNGFIVPMNDIETLAQKLQLLIDNSNLRENFQQNAINIRNKQNVETIINKWLNFIN